MKKVLFAFITLSLLSCSDDDSSATPSLEKNLEQMVVKRYQNNGNIYKDVYDFDDQNRVEIINRYDGQNEYFSKTTYEYDQMLLSAIKTYGDTMGDPSQPSSVMSFNYDGSLRIIGVDSYIETGIEGIHTISSFIYNADNTITEERTTSAPPEENFTANFTIYKNPNGRIIKTVDSEGQITKQAVFENYNLQSYSIMGLPYMAYLFNTDVTPKGQYHKIEVNKFDGNVNNAILAQGFGVLSDGVSNYVSQRTYSNGGINEVVSYQYEFDEDGYPIKVSLFKAGSSQPYEVREITYQ